MGTFNDGDSGSSIRTKLNTAIQKTEGTSAISTIDVDGGAIDGVTIGTNSAVTDLRVDNLQLDGNTVSSTNLNGDITIDPNGTGDVNIGNFKFDADQTVGVGQDNYVLTYDNAGGKISLEAAAGGAGAALYDANESSPLAQPSATGGNAIAIGDSAVSSGIRSVAFGKGNAAGNDSFAAAIGNASTSLGARAANSVAIGPSADCNRSNSIALGYQATVAGGAGTGTVAISQSYASGADSFAAVITNNTSAYGATGANSIAIGKQNKATATISTAIGGQNNVASNNYAFVTGNGSTASGYASVSLGHENTASDFYTVATGGKSVASLYGKVAHASGNFSTNGDAQGGQFILRADTTDATATVLTTNNSTAGSTNQIVAASDTCITFHGTVVAMQDGAQSYGGFKVEGLLVNDGGTTSLAASTVTAIQNTSGWTVALSADNTNNALAITVTGEAAHNIRWVANISTSEVTYA